MSMRGPKSYQSMEEFEREELRPGEKCGWSLDDLYQEAKFNASEEGGAEEAQELDFDY